MPQNSQNWSKWANIGQNFAFTTLKSTPAQKSTPPPVVTGVINMSYVHYFYWCNEIFPSVFSSDFEIKIELSSILRYVIRAKKKKKSNGSIFDNMQLWCTNSSIAMHKSNIESILKKSSQAIMEWTDSKSFNKHYIYSILCQEHLGPTN